MKASPQRVACRYMRAATQGLSGFLGKYVYKRYRSLVESAVASAADRLLETTDVVTAVEAIMSSPEVVTSSLYRAEFDDVLEEWLLEIINRGIPHNPVGPWSLRSIVERGGVLKVHYMFAGEEVDEDTEHPGDTHDLYIQSKLKDLGANSASCRWSLDRTPRSWGFDGGDRYIVAYEGMAEFTLDPQPFFLAGIGSDRVMEEVKGVAKLRHET